ncbi:hypothetical protein Tco_1122818 [Tanacetum coccineum]|uniref:Uncharacterized protein n=1 Tax=Tanacetum coccineum TaxID=301880 RepID=A0ABQ5J452_9ASTR
MLLMLTNNGWVDGSGSNPGGGFGKPRGGRETRGGEDGLEGPGGQLSMCILLLEMDFDGVMKSRGGVECKACRLDEQNLRCLEDWENFDFQDLVVDGWVDGNGLNPDGVFRKPGGGRETRGGGDGLKGPDV